MSARNSRAISRLENPAAILSVSAVALSGVSAG
jgi:hypothetical protein